MDEQNKIERAQATFSALCRGLDENEWPYQKDEEKLRIHCSARGEDLPVEITVVVDSERMVVLLLSPLSFKVQEDKRVDVALAISAINNKLVDGCFDYDITEGRMHFRMTNSFIESELDEEVFKYMVGVSCKTVDDFNDKLLMLAKGLISVEQLLATI